ncbi:MAG TPA: hypothetical protein VGD01_11525 [Candidatus Elarobacter sp.]
MPVKIIAYVLYSSAILMTSPVCSAAQQQATDDLASHAAGATRAVQAFSRTHSTEDLRTAVFEMLAAGNLNGLKPSTFVAQRRTLIRGWAELFKAIDDAYDPTYDPDDPKNLPARNLPDPRDIPDQKLRAEIAAEVAANPQKIARRAHYFDLYRVDMLAQNSLKMQWDQLRRVEPDGTDADFAALDRILQQTALNTARRTKINAMFYARGVGAPH